MFFSFKYTVEKCGDLDIIKCIGNYYMDDVDVKFTLS